MKVGVTSFRSVFEGSTDKPRPLSPRPEGCVHGPVIFESCQQREETEEKEEERKERELLTDSRAPEDREEEAWAAATAR